MLHCMADRCRNSKDRFLIPGKDCFLCVSLYPYKPARIRSPQPIFPFDSKVNLHVTYMKYQLLSYVCIILPQNPQEQNILTFFRRKTWDRKLLPSLKKKTAYNQEIASISRFMTRMKR